MGDPFVSIITPSYNQGQFIEETILSVKNQTYPYIEHLVMDGGSRDDTLSILCRYEGAYNMRWVSEPDQGQADAINKGFQLAQGNILCWLNSDDIYVSDQVISRVVSLFQEHPHIGIVTGSAVFLTKEGRWQEKFRVAKDIMSHEYLRYAAYIIQPATFFRRNTLTSVRLDASLHYAFDWDFFVQLTRQADILAVDEIWAGYRLWGNNKTTSGGAIRLKELVEVTGRYLGRKSWQYRVMRLYYFLYKGSEILPELFQDPFQKLLIKISKIVNQKTGYRVANII
jgi:glycosyltransferase involved in cell wall biosynthesis